MSASIPGPYWLEELRYELVKTVLLAPLGPAGCEVRGRVGDELENISQLGLLPQPLVLSQSLLVFFSLLASFHPQFVLSSRQASADCLLPARSRCDSVYDMRERERVTDTLKL